MLIWEMSAEIIAALESSDSFGALLRIGEESFADWIETLGEVIATLEREGVLGRHKYSVTEGDFVPI